MVMVNACTLLGTADAEQLHGLLAKKRFVQADAFVVDATERWIAYSTTHNTEEPEGKLLRGLDGVPCTARCGEIRLRNLEDDTEIVLGSDAEVCWRPSFSPDGRHMAYYSNRGGMARLWIYDLGLREARQVSDMPIRPSLLPGDRPQWTPDGKSILAWGWSKTGPSGIPERQERPNGQPHVSSSYRELPKQASSMDSFEGNGPLLLLDVASGAVDVEIPAVDCPQTIATWLSPTGQWICHWSGLFDNGTAYEQVVLVPLNRPGQARVVAMKMRYDPRQEGFPPCLWHPFRDELFYVDDHGLASLAWDDETRQWQARKWAIGTQLSLMRSPFVFSSDGAYLYVGADGVTINDYARPRRLLRIAMATGSQESLQLPEDVQYQEVITSSPGRVWSSSPDQIMISVRRDQRPEILLGLFEAGTWTVVDRGEPDEGRTRLTALPDRDVIIGILSSNTSTDNVMQYSVDYRPQKQLSDLNPQIDVALSCSVENVWTAVTSATGMLEQVRMCVILPPGVSPGQRPPGIVSLYPGDNMARAAHRLVDAEVGGVPLVAFLQNGYAILLPDLTLDGSLNPLHDTAQRLTPQVENACALGLVDGQRLGVMGASYGGYGSAGMTALTDLFKAGVCVAGLYDLPSCYAYMGGSVDPWTDYFEDPHAQGYMGSHPWGAIQRYLDNSPYYLANRINTPLLLVHGEDDQCCPVAESQKMYVALKRLGKKVDLATYPGEGHSIFAWGLRSSVDASQRVLEFFDMHLQQHADGDNGGSTSK